MMGTNDSLLTNRSAVKRKSVRANMLWNTAGSLVYQGCLWATTVLVVLLSGGYVESGILALAMATGNMYTPLATFNMRGFQATDAQLKYTQRNYIGFRLVTLLAGLSVMVPYALALSQDSNTAAAILAFLLFKVDESFCDVLYGIYQKGERMDFIGRSQIARGILMLGGFSAGLYFAHGLVVAIIAMYVAGMGVTLLYDLPHAAKFGSVRPNINWSTVWKMLRECTPLVVGSLLLSSVVAVARQYYGVAFSTEELGIYAAVATPAVIVQALARFVYMPMLVPLSQRWAMQDFGSFRNQCLRVCVGIGICSAAGTIALSLVGPSALELVYGKDISAHTYLFTGVLVSMAFTVLGAFLTDVLVVIRNLRGFAISPAVAVICCLVLMVPFERAFGLSGINYVVIVAMLVNSLTSASLVVVGYRAARTRSS